MSQVETARSAEAKPALGREREIEVVDYLHEVVERLDAQLSPTNGPVTITEKDIKAKVQSLANSMPADPNADSSKQRLERAFYESLQERYSEIKSLSRPNFFLENSLYNLTDADTYDVRVLHYAVEHIGAKLRGGESLTSLTTNAKHLTPDDTSGLHFVETFIKKAESLGVLDEAVKPVFPELPPRKD